METIARATRLLSRITPKSETLYPTRLAVPSPLSFGRVNDGHPITSQTLLFRLPIELVQEVVAYLDTADLRSLALVDRDCRQLARSRLFTSVVLDYSDEKWTLLDKLSHHEARSRRANGGATESPSIGACIRRVTVVTRSRGISSRHRMLSSTDDGISKEDKCVIHDAECIYCGIYLPDIAEALRFSLPNLDEFIWRDSVEIPQHMLTAIANSPIRHLCLRRIQLSLDCEYQLPPPEQQRWALRSLDLGTVVHPCNKWRDQDVSKFCLTILKAAAPTLEKLSWRDYQGTTSKLSFGSNAIRFPRLHTLSLDTLLMPDDTVLDAFFPPDAESCVLRSASIGVSSLHARESLAQRGHIRGLESLRLHTTPNHPPDPIATDAVFLSANPQLKSLTLRMHTLEQLTDTLLPLLASEFKFLTTLVVSFSPSKTGLRSESLAAIGQLTTLNSLWVVSGSRQEWTVGASATIAALSPLRNLTRLAVTRNHAALDFSMRRVGGRYRERMRNVVGLYAKAFRELKWVYFGELVHRVVGNVVVPEEGDLTRYSPDRVWESSDWCR